MSLLERSNEPLTLRVTERSEGFAATELELKLSEALRILPERREVYAGRLLGADAPPPPSAAAASLLEVARLAAMAAARKPTAGLPAALAPLDTTPFLMAFIMTGTLFVAGGALLAPAPAAAARPQRFTCAWSSFTPMLGST